MQKTINILCIGDSHTAGFPSFDPLYGGDRKSSYEYWLNLLLKRKYKSIKFIIDNKGSCGQTSSEVFNRFKNILIKKKYDISIFWAGANDIALGYSVKKIWNNLLNAANLARDYNLLVLLVTIPPMNWPGFDSIVRDLNEKIISNTNHFYFFADVYKVLEEKGNLKTDFDVGDGVHLSQDGYQEVGGAIFNVISPLVKSILNSDGKRSVTL